MQHVNSPLQRRGQGLKEEIDFLHNTINGPTLVGQGSYVGTNENASSILSLLISKA
jgi:hypothetical protein